MRSIPLLWLGALAASSAFALSGTVKDPQGIPIGGATLALTSSPGRTATSGADGQFTLAVGTSVRGQDGEIAPQRIRLEPQEEQLVLVGTTREPISLVSGDGKTVLVHPRPLLEAGTEGYSLPRLSPGMYLVRVGREPVASARIARVGDRWLLAGGSADQASPPALARQAAAIDTLVAQKTGYATARVAVPSYDQNLAVVLEAAPSVVRSAGCDKTRTLVNGTHTIQSGGKSRKYILGAPATYDKAQAYRLVFAYAESGSSAQSVANRNYFRMAGYDPKGTIFVAPDAENGAGSWSKTDVGFTDDILAQVEGDLCVDKSRIFATGFSFGGAMSIAIACTRADVFRGVAFFSGADLTGSCPTTLTKPIAYYASQASGDASGAPTPTSGRTKQAEFAKVNGCTADANAITFPATGKAHTCTVYKNCSEGHPTVYCVFDGAHGWEPVDPGQSTSWDPPEAWKFITQF